MKTQIPTLFEEELPVNYRSDIVSQVFDNINNCESFSLIGMEDACKSNIARFCIYRTDIQKKYLNKDYNKFIYVYVDLNELTEPSIIGFYHLVGLSLIETLKQQIISFNFLNNIFVESPAILFKAIKEDLKSIIDKTGKRIVLVFNDFDVVNKFDIELIGRNLVALRNVSRYKISYVFIGTRPFMAKEFFFKKVVYVTPFSGTEAQGVIERNISRYGVKLTFGEKTKIEKLSGGHPGTVKFLIQAIANSKNTKDVLQNFMEISDICFQCERILFPLTDLEKVKLKTNQPDEYLLKIGIQKLISTKTQIFSPILESHLNENTSCIKPFCLDEEINEIYFFGRPILKDLTVKESAILKFLIKYPENVYTRDQIIESTWGDEEFPTDWAFDKLISRLRTKLKKISDTEHPRTIHGMGYSLY